MQKLHLKKIMIMLAIILLLNTVLMPYLSPAYRVKADSSIEKEDIYTGLGLMFLLVVLAGGNEKNVESSDEQINREDFYDYKNFNAEEMEILASIINAEARGESYQGKVAVGAVIINRVYHPSFPNTIKDVVYQSGQFKPVDNGMINLSPSSDSYQAAYDAADGIDPSNGSLYFYNPAKSTNPQFFAKRTKMAEIGNHVFLK